MMICDILAATCYMIQYFLLGAYSGALTQILAAGRAACILMKDKRGKEWPWLLCIFLGLYLVIGIVTFDSWYSIL